MPAKSLHALTLLALLVATILLAWSGGKLTETE